MQRIGQKNNTAAKQSFMFHYRCLLPIAVFLGPDDAFRDDLEQEKFRT